MKNMQCLSVTALLVLVGCSGGVAGDATPGSAHQMTGDPHPVATTMVYDCAGYQFVTRQGPGEVALWLPDRYLVLSQVPAASGTKYQEGDVEFWSKGDEAMLDVAGQPFRGCQSMPHLVPWEDARRRGVDFRAVGNEPGWYLEFQQGRQLLLVADYGKTRVMAADPVEHVQGATRVYLADAPAGPLRVEVVDEPCHDTMSGEAFAAQVTVSYDQHSWYGCGRPLDYPWQ
jgi:membrane-bound inhibitor of C-type lysozyme/uncharacterized membrane protein